MTRRDWFKILFAVPAVIVGKRVVGLIEEAKLGAVIAPLQKVGYGPIRSVDDAPWTASWTDGNRVYDWTWNTETNDWGSPAESKVV
mgnify:CR=1 FL=1